MSLLKIDRLIKIILMPTVVGLGCGFYIRFEDLFVERIDKKEKYRKFLFSLESIFALKLDYNVRIFFQENTS